MVKNNMLQASLLLIGSLYTVSILAQGVNHANIHRGWHLGQGPYFCGTDADGDGPELLAAVLGPQCGATIWIKNTGTFGTSVNNGVGNCIQAKLVDQEGGGAVDLNPAAWSALTGSPDGQVAVEWGYGSCPGGGSSGGGSSGGGSSGGGSSGGGSSPVPVQDTSTTPQPTEEKADLYLIAYLHVPTDLVHPLMLHSREHDGNAVNCAMCHNSLTDPAGWSRALKERDINDVLHITTSKTNGQIKKRGSNWDGTHGEDNRKTRENTIDRYLDERGTAWDNSRDGDDATLSRRGSAWDNISGIDQRKALGLTVGQGGKPQPLYGNGWEHGRLTRKSSPTALASRARENRVDDGQTIPAQQGGCINCLVRRLIRRIYPWGSRFGAKDGSPTSYDIVKRAEGIKRDVAAAGGKPTPLKTTLRPAGGCINCLIKRWVSSPYISSLSAPRTKETSEKRDGGVPMPLCLTCWFRRVKRCVAGAKESGWNHGWDCSG
ncbi:MAG: hypothetical protein Q9224_004093 [Gallowayella concinna]